MNRLNAGCTVKEHYLIIDTSTAIGHVVLMTPQHTHVKTASIPRSHQSFLWPAIHEVLAQEGISLNEISGLSVTCGPGSFIGVRLALSVIKAIAMTHALPVVSLSTLHVLAQSAALKHSIAQVEVVEDARGGHLYLGSFIQDDHGLMQAHGDECYVPYTKWCQQLKAKNYVGSGLQAYPQTQHGDQSSVWLPKIEIDPQALCQITRDKMHKQHDQDPYALNAVYLEGNKPWRKV